MSASTQKNSSSSSRTSTSTVINWQLKASALQQISWKRLKNISAPTNTKEFSSPLGLPIYLNCSSAKKEEYTAPLHTLTKRNPRFRWEDYHQAPLDKIKAELSSAHILSYYDPDPATTTILQCDASQEGLRAWLREVDATGKEGITAMASRSLTDAKSQYSNIERECLAVMAVISLRVRKASGAALTATATS